MSRAVIFDLYETLISENHPEWHSLQTEGPTPDLPFPAKCFDLVLSGHFLFFYSANRNS